MRNLQTLKELYQKDSREWQIQKIDYFFNSTKITQKNVIFFGLINL